MTIQKIKMTEKELDKLINGRLDTDRFEETFNDIPMYHPDHVIEKGETHRSYIEDDGREYRWMIIVDKQTGNEHYINYTYNPEWPNDILSTPDFIEIVERDEDSDFYVKPVPVVVAEHVLSPEAQADKDLCEQYKLIEAECTILPRTGKIPVPKEKIDEVLAFLKTKEWGVFQLRAIILPICIDHKVEQNSFWHWLQVKRKVWKA